MKTLPIKKKKKIFGKFIGVWSILLIIAACIIGSWGHYEWTQASINKERDAAYQDGVNNSTDTPTVKSVLKIQEQEKGSYCYKVDEIQFKSYW